MSNSSPLPRFPSRLLADNAGTFCGFSGPRLTRPLDARRFFVNHYPPIRRALEKHDRLGLALLVFDDRREPVAGHWVEARLDRTTSMVFGRHSVCAVAAPPSAAEVSLRHAVVTVRAVSHDALRARIFDLRTQHGFADETGRDLRGVTIDGTGFFRFGDLTVVALVTGEDPSCFIDAEDAYQAIPARVFVEAQTASPTDPRIRLVHPSPHESGEGITFVRSQLAVMPQGADLLGPDEVPEGLLHVETQLGGRYSQPVGRAALCRGLLFGRYDRCDVGRRGATDKVSRVHLLLVRDRGELIAIDTASSNGSYSEGREFRQLSVRSGTTIELGGELRIRWVEAT